MEVEGCGRRCNLVTLAHLRNRQNRREAQAYASNDPEEIANILFGVAFLRDTADQFAERIEKLDLCEDCPYRREETETNY